MTGEGRLTSRVVGVTREALRTVWEGVYGSWVPSAASRRTLKRKALHERRVGASKLHLYGVRENGRGGDEGSLTDDSRAFATTSFSLGGLNGELALKAEASGHPSSRQLE
ncbi:hypothetical protein MTO96_003714 [Rhipicephalus appendiculatus]